MDKKNTHTILNKETGELETYDLHTGEIIATNSAVAPGAKFLYSVEMADAICNLIREGLTYKKIAARPDMPDLHLLLRWKAIHPDFAKRLKEARKDRATLYHDEAVTILEEAEDVETRDDINKAKFRFESFLKLAERGSPEEFGQKNPAQVAQHTPPMIVINTGVSRDAVKIEGVINEKEDMGRSARLADMGESEQVEEIREAIGAEIGGLEEAGAEIRRTIEEESIKEESIKEESE